jgi:hypothetical protein
MGKQKQINSIEDMVEWMNGEFDLEMRITRVLKNGMIRLENLPTIGKIGYKAYTGTSHQAISFLGVIRREMERKIKAQKKAERKAEKEEGIPDLQEEGNQEKNQEEPREDEKESDSGEIRPYYESDSEDIPKEKKK